MATTKSKYSTPNMYIKKPNSISEYAMMRGVTDFTNPAQFNLYEKGYQFLYVLSIPKYIDMLSENPIVANMTNAFCNIIEQEFKGLSGIDDITTEDLEVTDGISTMNVIGKVTKQSSAEVSTSYTEKSGALITNFIKYYLEGIRDPRTQAKTYHGLIKNGKLGPGFQNEVFTLLYVVTDNTMLMLEKAYLLCNAYPTAAKTSIYEGEKGSIEKVDVDISWRCFIIDNDEVDKRAVKFLAKINEHGGDLAKENAVAGAYYSVDGEGIANADAIKEAKIKNYDANTITLDSNSYKYSVLTAVDSVINSSSSK